MSSHLRIVLSCMLLLTIGTVFELRSEAATPETPIELKKPFATATLKIHREMLSLVRIQGKQINFGAYPLAKDGDYAVITLRMVQSPAVLSYSIGGQPSDMVIRRNRTYQISRPITNLKTRNKLQRRLSELSSRISNLQGQLTDLEDRVIDVQELDDLAAQIVKYQTMKEDLQKNLKHPSDREKADRILTKAQDEARHRKSKLEGKLRNDAAEREKIRKTLRRLENERNEIRRSLRTL